MFKQIFDKFSNIITILVSLFFIGLILLFLGIGSIFYYFKDKLPDHKQLADYSLPTISRVYAQDGQVIGEFAKEKRLFVPITAIPKRLSNAFIAAEDKNFYSHPGVDVFSIARAALINLKNLGKNIRPVGGSTITQQVVKNFLLDNEPSLTRKIKEAILSLRITKTFSKDRILELYLNKIYLGNKSYGVAAAALNYFNKSIEELEIEEVALLASLPKAPSNLNPYLYKEKVKIRRNWVIKRMLEEGYINEMEAVLAISKPIILQPYEKAQLLNAGFFTDQVKQKTDNLLGENSIMSDGLSIHTSLDPNLQKIAEDSLMSGINAYDQRHGYRGPIYQLENLDNWQGYLTNNPNKKAPKTWKKSVVLEVNDEKAVLGFKDGSTSNIYLRGVDWAREFIDQDNIGPLIKKVSSVLKTNDVIYVENNNDVYYLRQIPQINGSLIAMNPHTGQILALVGGYDYANSSFNRAVQAKRQPGSALKPFIYLTALENGFKPNSIIVDEEVQLEQGDDQPEWKPQNHSGKFYGPTTLRIGIEKSRNAMTVRLAQLVGINKIVNTIKKFDINNNPERNFAVVLGSAETTLLDITRAYAMLVNGGKKINPTFIEKISNKNGKIIFRRNNAICKLCNVDPKNFYSFDNIYPPLLMEEKEQIVDPIIAYQMVSMLEGVIQRGTGRKAKKLNKNIAGKTGTTNNSFDAWFIGFSPDLVVGVYSGFDTPKSLGEREYGSSIALPIWQNFMKKALREEPNTPFRKPDGIKLVKIDKNTGLLPSHNTPKSQIIFEAFKEGDEPKSANYSAINEEDEEEGLGSGGIY